MPEAEKMPEESAELSAEEKLITQVAAEARRVASLQGEEAVSEESIDTTQEQIADLSDRLARALAEAENTRRRFLRERQDALRYGASQLAMDVFEVADNLQRARSFVSDEAMEKDASLKNLVLGIRMTEKSLEEAFKRNQIIAIVPKIGEPFCAEQHQAVSHVENDELADGAVIELLQNGYQMGERLLRAAQVITVKNKSQDDEETQDDEGTQDDDGTQGDEETQDNEGTQDDEKIKALSKSKGKDNSDGNNDDVVASEEEEEPEVAQKNPQENPQEKTAGDQGKQ